LNDASSTELIVMLAVDELAGHPPDAGIVFVTV
jgi:hypothetical protein